MLPCSEKEPLHFFSYIIVHWTYTVFRRLPLTEAYQLTAHYKSKTGWRIIKAKERVENVFPRSFALAFRHPAASDFLPFGEISASGYTDNARLTIRHRLGSLPLIGSFSTRHSSTRSPIGILFPATSVASSVAVWSGLCRRPPVIWRK